MKKFSLLPFLFAVLLAAPLPVFAASTTPMQAAAHRLQNDLNQALQQSTYSARRRYQLRQDAAALVKAANRRAQGHRIKRRRLRRNARELLKAFDSGRFPVGDATLLNQDFQKFKKSIH